MHARIFRLVLMVGVVSASAAFAQDGERPWAKGVDPEKQRQALEMFRDGNASLKESLFVKAAAKYREALALWDHPAIHYNLALALVNLDQPVETHEHLVAALKYGAAPLDSDKFEQAQRYKGLVEKQLAKVDIRCEEPGAEVKIDGRTMFTAPGAYQGLLRSGPHTILASKAGYLSAEESRVLPAGETTTFALKLKTAEEATEYRRLWPAYVPWLVVGGGAVLAGVGAALHLSSRDSFTKYDQQVATCAAGNTASPGTCVPPTDLTALRQGALGSQTTAFIMYGLGGATLVTGAILLYVNRLVPYTATGEVKVQASLIPVLTPNSAQALFSLSF